MPRGIRIPRWPVASALLLTALAADPGCHRRQPQAAVPPPPEVSVAKPVTRTVIDWDEYVGRIDAVDSVDVRARVSGYVESIHFVDGSVVKQGDLLFIIDPRPYQAQVDLTKAQIDAAQAQLELGKINLARMKEALPAHAVSQQDYDQAFFTVRNNQAQLAVAQANLDLAKLNLEWTHVTAAITGRINRHLVTPGNLITGGTAQATLLTNITSLDPIFCYINADEQAVLKYRRMAIEKQRVSARDARIPCFLVLSDGSDYPFQGYIDFVANQFDPSTGTLEARGVFPNPDRVLEPGMFGRLRIAGSGPRRAILVADQAVGTNQSQRYVLIVGPDNKVQQRTVTVGALHDGLREIIAGLTGDEHVIVEGLLRARPGAIVLPSTVPMPTLVPVTKPNAPTTFPSTAPSSATRTTAFPATTQTIAPATTREGTTP